MQLSSSNPLWMKDVLERDHLCDTPTQEFPAIIVPKPVEPPKPAYLPDLATSFVMPKQMLPRDRLGRPYVRAINPDCYTLDLVSAAVQYFLSVEHSAPTVILLRAWRYLEYGAPMKCYYPSGGGQPIPYGYEVGCTYDVLVRGQFDGN